MSENKSKQTKAKISADEFDRLFDEGKEDIMQHVDRAAGRQPNQDPRRVNVDFPPWMVEELDAEARRLGITRQSLIKIWIGGKLDALSDDS